MGVTLKIAGLDGRSIDRGLDSRVEQIGTIHG
jgi:hypothetical protein